MVISRGQQMGNTFRVVNVHLATECFHIEFFRVHGKKRLAPPQPPVNFGLRNKQFGVQSSELGVLKNLTLRAPNSKPRIRISELRTYYSELLIGQIEGCSVVEHCHRLRSLPIAYFLLQHDFARRYSERISWRLGLPDSGRWHRARLR